jgi:hypothetical protein
VLTALSTDSQWEILKPILARMADASERSLPMLEVAPEEALDSASSELDYLSDALLEAAVRIARGERSGGLKHSLCETLVLWSAGPLLQIRIDTPPARPQGLALARAMLELEPWTTSIEVCPTLQANRWTLQLSPRGLETSSAREWLSTHTVTRDRRPELISWLLEGMQ